MAGTPWQHGTFMGCPVYWPILVPFSGRLDPGNEAQTRLHFIETFLQVIPRK